MRTTIILTIALLSVGPAFAADKVDVMVPVHQFADGFDKHDMKAAVAACASPAFILDEFPPHAWQGPNACADWWKDFEANAKATHLSDPVVKITKVNSVDVTGDRAYVVTTASYDWKENGTPAREVDSTWTFALQRIAAGWRIVGWAWSRH